MGVVVGVRAGFVCVIRGTARPGLAPHGTAARGIARDGVAALMRQSVPLLLGLRRGYIIARSDASRRSHNLGARVRPSTVLCRVPVPHAV